MAKKKILANEVRKDDVILLDRPRVKIIADPESAAKRFRACPKGALIVQTKDETTGHESEVLFLEDDKVDIEKRPTRWDRFKKWLDGNHKKYVETKAKKPVEIPLIFK